MRSCQCSNLSFAGTKKPSGQSPHSRICSFELYTAPLDFSGWAVHLGHVGEEMNRKQRRAERKQVRPVMHVASPGVQEMFADAVRHHQAGRLHEAERLSGKFWRPIPAMPTACTC